MSISKTMGGNVQGIVLCLWQTNFRRGVRLKQERVNARPAPCSPLLYMKPTVLPHYAWPSNSTNKGQAITTPSTQQIL